MHLPAILDRALLLFPDQPAVCCHGEWLSYRQLGDRVARLAGALAVRGVRPGDRVAAWLPNRREYLEVYFAAAVAGAVLVPVNHRLAVPEIVGLMAHAGARYIGSLEETAAYLIDHLSPPAVLLTMGAGDGYQIGEWVLEQLSG